MKCNDVRYDLFLVSDGEQLPPERLRQLEAHLSECASCRAFQELSKYVDHLVESDTAEVDCLEAEDPLVKNVTAAVMARLQGPASEFEASPEHVPTTLSSRIRAGLRHGLRHAGNHLTIRRVAVAAALAFACGVAYAGVKGVGELQELIRLRRDAEQKQEAYEATWSLVRFDDIIRPVIRPLPAEAGSRSDKVRVELSPRVEEGWIRTVHVSWGDTSGGWETIYDALGSTGRSLQAVHDYQLPPEGESAYHIQVSFTVPDAVAAARQLTPSQLTYSCVVKATPDGVTLTEAGVRGPKAQLAKPSPPAVTWLQPASGSDVCWKTAVDLKSDAATEKVTLLVRPRLGTTFYV